jgi:poly(hydroxyalkanoate) depolymerase family esterase
MWQEFLYNDASGSHPYFVYTPEHYTVGTAVPLMVMLHGCTQKAIDFAAGTRMNQLADQYNFIVVYPQQTSANNRTLCWNWFHPSNQVRGSGEPASIVGIMQAVQDTPSAWTIDPARIYVAGISAGAAMSVILGATYPDLFAAIGIHSGVEYQAAATLLAGLKAMQRGGPDPLQQGSLAYHAMSDMARMLPTIIFHGTKDRFVAPINGDQVVQQWLRTNTLASQGSYTADFSRPTSVIPGQVPGGRAYTTASWNDANGETVQEYWKIGGMGHAWSGGNPESSYTDRLGPDASSAMYTFFMAHPLKSMESSISSTMPLKKKIIHILGDFFSRRNTREPSARH